MFLQIHTLTSYAAALLNRDDAGLAKRIPFGNSERLRVSSQCLKRHWRQNLLSHLEMASGIRTRHVFSRAIFDNLRERGLDQEQALVAATTLKEILMASKEKADDEKDAESGPSKKRSRSSGDHKHDAAEDLMIEQPILFGRPEVEYLCDLVDLITRKESAGDVSKAIWMKLTGEPGKPKKRRSEKQKDQIRDNFAAMLQAAGKDNLATGIEGALFGRFVTSDILARTDAAVHVAHAFTVHPLDTEVAPTEVVSQGATDEQECGQEQRV